MKKHDIVTVLRVDITSAVAHPPSENRTVLQTELVQVSKVVEVVDVVEALGAAVKLDL